MKKRWIAVLFATLLITGSVLTGCASNKPVNSPASTPQTTAPVLEPPAATGSNNIQPTFPQQGGQSTFPAKNISQDQAKQIALQDAGLTEADIAAIVIKEDLDDGRYIYDVEFYAQNKEYDYEIDAATGGIISSDFEIQDHWYDGISHDDGHIISEEDARNAALGRVPGATQNDIRIHLDYDDGMQVYEGDIYYNNTEYEFQIDATTGEFIEWSQESR